MVDYIDVNVVPPAYYETVKARGEWPLRVQYATGKRESGITIVGNISSSNFIEQQHNEDGDIIKLRIHNFALGVFPFSFILLRNFVKI